MKIPAALTAGDPGLDGRLAGKPVFLAQIG
jgi:hypothetical protein